MEIGSGVATPATLGAGSEENVKLPAAEKGLRKPEPLSTNEGTTEESASENACVVGLMNWTKAELNVTDPRGGVEAERLAPVPPLFPVRVAFEEEVMVPDYKFVRPFTGVFSTIENVPVKPPSEIVPLLITSGVVEDRFSVRVAERGPDKPAGKVPLIFEKMK